EQLARRGERNRPGAPFEQFDAEQRFEPTNLVTDGARGDVELLRRLGQAQVPRRGLEGPQGIQWPRAMHEKNSSISRKSILCHASKPQATSITRRLTNENASKIKSGYAAMNAIAPRHDFARCQAIAMRPRDAPPRSGFLRCIVDPIM